MHVEMLLCPLCSTPHFKGVEALRTTLVAAATSHLSCPVCAEVLLGLDKLTIHLFSHINDMAKSKTISEESVRKEIDSSIDNISNNCRDDHKTCTVQEINTATFNAHKYAQNLEVIKCDICNFSFTDINIFEMHQKLLHQTSPDKKSGTYSYHCHLCSKKFKMRGSLMVHLRVAHYGFSNNNNNNNDNTEACEKVCESTADKKIHEQKISRKPKECEPRSLQKNIQIRQPDNKQWECDVCWKMFTTKYFLKKHKRLHTGEMPYCCSICNKSFTFQQSFHKHMLYHSSEKPYGCNECGRAFKELSTLQNHARIHSGERPFSCETCGKSFRQRVSYLVHRRIHTGVMPYKCTACDKSFRYKVSQRSHKCPIDPPGSVIRIPDQEKTTNQQVGSVSSGNKNITKDLQPVENRTESYVREKRICQSPSFIADCEIQKKSIILNNNEQIEISYNRADLELALNKNKDDLNINTGNETDYRKKDVLIANRLAENSQKLVYAAEAEKYLFSMVLSPILPEVESLCLSNGSPIPKDPEETETALEGKRFDEFLFGTI